MEVIITYPILVRSSFKASDKHCFSLKIFHLPVWVQGCLEIKIWRKISSGKGKNVQNTHSYLQDEGGKASTFSQV